jgi:hypothetical protein
MASSATASGWLHTIGQAADKYILLAILTGVLAALTYYAGYGSYAPYIVVGALLAGLTAASMQYASTGSIPGTKIPLSTLIVWGWAALLVVLERFAAVTAWTAPTIIAAAILFVSTLLIEVETGKTAAGESTTSPITLPNSTSGSTLPSTFMIDSGPRSPNQPPSRSS